MFPKSGNAFAQQKERERQRKLREVSQEKTSGLKRQQSKRSMNKSDLLTTKSDNVPGTPQTTLDMFLPKTRNTLRDPLTPYSRESHQPAASDILTQRSCTDPTQSCSRPHLSALPEPLFTEKQGPNPLTKLVSKLNTTSKEPLPSPAPPTLSEKALEILGGDVKGRSGAKFSSDTTKDICKSQRDPYPLSPNSSEGSESRSSYPSRRHPNPTKRWLIENQEASQQSPTELPKVCKVEHKSDNPARSLGHLPSEASDPDVIITNNLQPYSPHPKNKGGIIFGNSSLSPTRQGNYATINTVRVIDQERIASNAGSVVEPSPVVTWHPETSFLRTPSPLSARACPYDQRLYDERYLDTDSALTAHTSFQSQLSPTSCYSGYPSIGPWEHMYTHYPSTMPAFSPEAMAFRMDSLRPFTVCSDPFELQSPEPNSVAAPVSHSLPVENPSDPESTPRGPSKQARASMGSASASESEATNINSDNTGSPMSSSHALLKESTHHSNTTGSPGTAFSSSILSSSAPSRHSQPHPSPETATTNHLEHIIRSEFASLRQSLKFELSTLHSRIEATNNALLLTTKTLDQISSSMNALSKGVQIDVQALKTAQGQLCNGLRHEFNASEKLIHDSEQLIKEEVHRKIEELVEKYIRPMQSEMQAQHEVKKKAMETLMKGMEENQISGYAYVSPGQMGPLAVPVGVGREGNVESGSGSGSGSGFGGAGGGGGAGSGRSSASVLGGAWLRQAESMGGY